jgi:hypothetical protein
LVALFGVKFFLLRFSKGEYALFFDLYRRSKSHIGCIQTVSQRGKQSPLSFNKYS